MNGFLYTIGHSNQPLPDFLALLSQHQIEVLVDVRSAPYSKYASQFNQANLKTAVTGNGLKYLYLGKELGGRPADPRFYTETGQVDYARVAASPLFLEGLARLQLGLEKFRVAVMCSEESPLNCHRRRLISRALQERAIPVRHIRGDGTLQTEADLQTLENNGQLSLFSE